MASLVKRGKTYYLQWYVGRKIRRRSLRTDSYQIAKEKLRRFESARAQGDANPLPSRTPIAEVVAAYVEHIRAHKTPKSAQTDVYYLREVFGPICDPLRVTSRKVTAATRRRPRKPGRDGRVRPAVIEAECFEAITTAAVADFIQDQARSRGLAPKTANRYREILCRLFNWATEEGRVRMPAGLNPASKVKRFKERAPQIRYLTLPQIDEQLHALRFIPRLQTMVAMYIYAGLRREEALWLTTADIDLKAGPNGLIRIQAKTIQGESWQPKTKVNRAVPISRALRSFLARYVNPASEHDWYFPSPQGTRYDPDNLSRDLRAANARAALRWTCLDYRHTFGSLLAQRGVSLLQIATLMGNSPEICRRHYASLSTASLHHSVDFQDPQICPLSTPSSAVLS
jgi:integrase